MKIKILRILIMFLISSNVYSIELTNAAMCDGDPGSKSQHALDAGKVISTVYKNNNLKAGRCLGWTNLGNGNIWYEATKKMFINAVDINNNHLLGHWPLTPYTESIIMAGETPAAAAKIAAALGDEYTPNPNPLSQQTDPVILYSLYFKTYNTAYGCLQTSPLRYGDIEGDGKKELVLLLGNNFIIFSTTLNKVIFSAIFQQSDELTEEDKESYDVEHDAETSPQYIAFSGMDHLLGYYHLYPAWRSFAKLFTSDFNNDGKFDIVVWRKLYQSRLNSDPVLGFSKTGDLYVHYSLINGEYKLQTTEQADIQTWLTTNNLTWQKGYPSQSECAGQENQLIPEMHDPLLNDADVLK